MTELVTREDHEGLALLTLNRPAKLNALNSALFECLDAHRAQIAADVEHVGLVVLRGAGRCFSAGHDLADIAAGESLETLIAQGQMIERLAQLPQPLIVAVHGHCYTGALELALAGDLIVASASARFADTHAKWALSPMWGLSQRLPRRIGPSRAMQMMLSCRSYTGAEAQALGLADECYSDAEFESGWRALAQSILANSWYSLRANKALLRETEGLPLAAGLAQEVYRTRGVGPDMGARIAAFLGDRA